MQRLLRNRSVLFMFLSGWKRFSLLFGFLLTRRVFTGPLRSSRPMAWDEVCAAKTFQLSICLQLVVVCSTRYYSICTICVDLLSVWVCAICFGSVTRRRFLSIVCVLSIGSICSSIRNSNIHSWVMQIMNTMVEYIVHLSCARQSVYNISCKFSDGK